MDASEREVLEIEPTRLRLLRAIVEYVQDIHVHIDPDQFRIDQARLGAMLGHLAARRIDTLRISVTYQDLLFLSVTIDAAATYSNRRGMVELEGVDDEDYSDLLGWLADAEDRLVRKPPTIH